MGSPTCRRVTRPNCISGAVDPKRPLLCCHSCRGSDHRLRMLTRAPTWRRPGRTPTTATPAAATSSRSRTTRADSLAYEFARVVSKASSRFCGRGWRRLITGRNDACAADVGLEALRRADCVCEPRVALALTDDLAVGPLQSPTVLAGCVSIERRSPRARLLRGSRRSMRQAPAREAARGVVRTRCASPAASRRGPTRLVGSE